MRRLYAHCEVEFPCDGIPLQLFIVCLIGLMPVVPSLLIGFSFAAMRERILPFGTPAEHLLFAATTGMLSVAALVSYHVRK